MGSPRVQGYIVSGEAPLSEEIIGANTERESKNGSGARHLMLPQNTRSLCFR